MHTRLGTAESVAFYFLPVVSTLWHMVQDLGCTLEPPEKLLDNPDAQAPPWSGLGMSNVQPAVRATVLERREFW